MFVNSIQMNNADFFLQLFIEEVLWGLYTVNGNVFLITQKMFIPCSIESVPNNYKVFCS